MRLQRLGVLALVTGLVAFVGIDTRPAASTTEYTITDLGTLGGSWSSAEAINDVEQVVGGSTTTSGSEAFLWEQGKMRDLGTLRDGSYAFGINLTGEVVGNHSSVSGGSAFLYRDGVRRGTAEWRVRHQRG